MRENGKKEGTHEPVIRVGSKRGVRSSAIQRISENEMNE